MFELSGKIVNRSVSQMIGNLSEIKLPVPNELLGRIYFHAVKVFNDPGACFLAEKLFQLGGTD